MSLNKVNMSEVKITVNLIGNIKLKSCSGHNFTPSAQNSLRLFSIIGTKTQRFVMTLSQDVWSKDKPEGKCQTE